MKQAKITVFGGGIFGLCVAYFCLRKGARVQIVEKRQIGAGASGGLVGALAPHTPDNWNHKKAFQFDSLIMAQGFWDDVAALSGRDSGYGRVGRLQPLMDDRAIELARERISGADHLWKGHAHWSVLDEKSLGEWAPISATGLWAFDTLSARVHPRRAVESLAAAVVALGGDITDQPSKDAAAGLVVDSTGYEGLQKLSTEFDRPLGSGVKGQGALLAYDRVGAPQLFGDGVHIVPHSDGTVAIGSTSERLFEDPTSLDDQLDTVIEKAKRVCPVLRDAPVIARWAGVRPRAKTRSPMLGKHPTRENTFIANGGFKIGFGMAPKVGQVMANLLVDGIDEIPQGFRVSDNF